MSRTTTDAPVLITVPGGSNPSRSRYSCLACRKRKSGCNRLLPRCFRCLQWGTDCHYQMTPARRRKVLAHLATQRIPVFSNPVTYANCPSAGPPDLQRLPEARTLSPIVPLSPPSDGDGSLYPPSKCQTVTVPLVTTGGRADQDQLPNLSNPHSTTVVGYSSSWDDIGLEVSSLVSPTSPPNLITATPLALPFWLATSVRRLPSTRLALDSISQITSRLLFKLIRNRPASPQGITYLDQISRLVKQSDSQPPIVVSRSPGAGPFNTRSLIIPIDLLYHSSVVRHSIENFSTFIYKGCNPLNNFRVLFRLDNGLISKPFQLAAMMAVAPFSDHPIFDHITPHSVNIEYHSRLLSMVPFCLEDSSPDMYGVLNLVADATLNLGMFSLHQSLIAASIRKQQTERIHLLDHPNPPPRLAYLGSKLGAAVDVPAIGSEILRECYRVLWWAALFKDMIGALVLGHRPLIDLDDCYVNPPCPGVVVESLLDTELANPNSAIFTGKEYPTLLSNSRLKNNITIVKAEVVILGHHVAKLRALQTSDPAAWLNSLPSLNYELEQWHTRYTALARTDWQETEGTSDLPTWVEANTYYFQVRVLCATLIIHLNHFDGHSPDSPDPFPGLALNSALQAAGDLTGRTLSECHERCWTNTVRLRELLIDSATPPAFINNTLFIASLYPAAMVCSEHIHGMGSAIPSLVAAADRRLATRLIDEIVQVLDCFGDLWKANIKIVDEIRTMRDSPFVRRSLDIGHHLWSEL
ncbi:hypothetical protein H4R33_006925 [Dimargaris cristalligena]|nr:hypothetical protein H4R33_006925 [Dimargaris cristalligena]